MEPTTGKAKYYTLMEALKEQILSGTIKPGQKLPSENELTREIRPLTPHCPKGPRSSRK